MVKVLHWHSSHDLSKLLSQIIIVGRIGKLTKCHSTVCVVIVKNRAQCFKTIYRLKLLCKMFFLIRLVIFLNFIVVKSDVLSESKIKMIQLQISNPIQLDSVTHQMAVPVPSISCCILNHHNLFYEIQNALALNWDMCCHLVLCLRLLPFHPFAE